MKPRYCISEFVWIKYMVLLPPFGSITHWLRASLTCHMMAEIWSEIVWILWAFWKRSNSVNLNHIALHDNAFSSYKDQPVSFWLCLTLIFYKLPLHSRGRDGFYHCSQAMIVLSSIYPLLSSHWSQNVCDAAQMHSMDCHARLCPITSTRYPNFKLVRPRCLIVISSLIEWNLVEYRTPKPEPEPEPKPPKRRITPLGTGENKSFGCVDE